MSKGNAVWALAKTGPALNKYKEAELGVIEEGAWADILLVEGNPIEDVTVLRNRDKLRVIMKGGDVFKNTLGGM